MYIERAQSINSIASLTRGLSLPVLSVDRYRWNVALPSVWLAKLINISTCKITYKCERITQESSLYLFFPLPHIPVSAGLLSFSPFARLRAQ